MSGWAANKSTVHIIPGSCRRRGANRGSGAGGLAILVGVAAVPLVSPLRGDAGRNGGRLESGGSVGVARSNSCSLLLGPVRGGAFSTLKTAGRKPVQVRILCPPFSRPNKRLPRVLTHPASPKIGLVGHCIGHIAAPAARTPATAPARVESACVPRSGRTSTRPTRHGWSFAAFYSGVKAPRDRKPPSGVFTNNPRTVSP